MTPKQQQFIAEYLVDMNATKAAIRAGYSAKTAYSIGQENLKKPEIRQAINTAMTERRNNLIATREERQAFWSEIMRDEEAQLRDRLKASELLGKSECDFSEKLQLHNQPEEITIRWEGE